jgi:hypothetical protein
MADLIHEGHGPTEIGMRMNEVTDVLHASPILSEVVEIAAYSPGRDGGR